VTKKLKIGLLLDSTFGDKYLYRLSQWARTRPDLEISHLIARTDQRSALDTPETVGLPATRTGRSSVKRASRKAAFRRLIEMERKRLRNHPLHKDHYEWFRLSDFVPNTLTLTPAPQGESVTRFSPDDIEAIREQGLDLIIVTGPDAVSADLASASRLGTIVFDFGNNGKSGRWPPGFWEVYHGCAKTPFAIRILTAENNERALTRGSFRTQAYCSLNQAHLYSKVYPQLERVLKQIAAAGKLPTREIVPYCPPAFEVPHLSTQFRYITKLAARKTRARFEKAIGIDDYWAISFVSAGWRDAFLQKSWSPTIPEGRYWADPCLLRYGDNTYCFVEDYVYDTERGHITALQVHDGRVTELGPALVEPFHLSFPFVFVYQHELYMCPECAGSNEIRIYRCTGFPLQWELCSVPIKDVSAADSILFEHRGKWWLVTSLDESGTGDHCSELHVFHASSPLATHWTPHPLNPVIIDPEGGRNAGLIIDDGKLYRLAQRQGFQRYGSAILIREIVELTDCSYREHQVDQLSPNFKGGLVGTHHLSTTGTVTVVDHVRRLRVHPCGKGFKRATGALSLTSLLGTAWLMLSD
jgi:hypothetical protein